MNPEFRAGRPVTAEKRKKKNVFLTMMFTLYKTREPLVVDS